MTHKHNGGPAFPCEWDYINSNRSAANGMSLRDYFAAKAMQASLSRGAPVNIEAMAKAAYTYADAMLAQRENENDQ